MGLPRDRVIGIFTTVDARWTLSLLLTEQASHIALA